MDLIVGGQSATIGILEHSLLVTSGLRSSDTIVDIGCGSGRLSTRLASRHEGKFIGTDILEELTGYATKKAGRDDWEFHVATKPPLPIEDGAADVVCAFSVFTHLLDEDIFKYMAEAHRIMKPGGKLIFSYLDFAVPSHWAIFELTLADPNPNAVLNKFVSKDAIRVWAEKLGFTVDHLHDGHVEWISLLEDIQYVDGRKASGLTGFGQSVAVLSKP